MPRGIYPRKRRPGRPKKVAQLQPAELPSVLTPSLFIFHAEQMAELKHIFEDGLRMLEQAKKI